MKIPKSSSTELIPLPTDEPFPKDGAKLIPSTWDSLQHFWAAPEVRPSAADLMEEKEWSSCLKTRTSSRALEWYLECNFLGYQTLRKVAEITPRRRGGVPVLKGTRFTVSQALAELADSSGVEEVARNFDLDAQTIKEMLEGLSLILMQPIIK